MNKIERLEYEVSAFNWGRINLVLDFKASLLKATVMAVSMGALDFKEYAEEVNIIDDNFSVREGTLSLQKDAEDFIYNILNNKLHFNTWKAQYEDPFTTDGESWELTINYENGNKMRSCGLCKFPEEYQVLMEIIKPIIEKFGIIV